MPIATTSGRSSSGPPMQGSPSSKPNDPTSSSTALRWSRRVGSVNHRPTAVDICGFYRFAHIDGRVTANPAQYVRRPKVHPSEGRGLDRQELGTFLFTAERFDRDHAALAVLLGLNGLRVSEACGTNIEDLAFTQGHRTLRIMGKGSKPAVIPLVPRAARTVDLAIGERTKGPILRRKDGSRLDRRTAHRWVRSIGKQAGLTAVYPHMLRSAFIMAALDAGVPLRDVQIAARHADPRTTTVYDRRRETPIAMLPMSLLPSLPADNPEGDCRPSSRLRSRSDHSPPIGD